MLDVTACWVKPEKQKIFKEIQVSKGSAYLKYSFAVSCRFRINAFPVTLTSLQDLSVAAISPKADQAARRSQAGLLAIALLVESLGRLTTLYDCKPYNRPAEQSKFKSFVGSPE